MGEWSEDLLLDSFLLEQDRIYGVMFCMCIDRGCIGTGNNWRAVCKCAVEQLFVGTALVTVILKCDLLCHSHLDGSQGYVAMICQYQILQPNMTQCLIS